MALQTSAGYAAMCRLFQWSTKPLQYAVVRVNTLRISPEEALEKTRLGLAQEASLRGRVPPTAQMHPVIPEALFISAWPGQKPLFAQLPERKDWPVVIVDITCGNAVLRGADVFTGGVLAITETASVDDPVRIEAFREGARAHIGYGILRSFPPENTGERKDNTRDTIEYDRAVEVTEGLSILPPLPRELSINGLAVHQSLPAIVTSRVVNPQPGERVLELGCGTGYITTHLAALSSNQADIVSMHTSAERISTIKARCSLLGANVTVIVAEPADFAEKETAKFDKILIYPNHSSIGVRPYVPDFAESGRGGNYQIRELIETTFDLLKPGGRLVYCTASALPFENDGVVRWVLNQRPDFRLVPAEPRIAAGSGQPFLPTSSSMRLSHEEEKLIQRFGPLSADPELDPINANVPCFFIACFSKKQ